MSEKSDHDLLIEVSRDVKSLVKSSEKTQERLSRIEAEKPSRREVWMTFAGLVGVSGLVATVMLYMGG